MSFFQALPIYFIAILKMILLIDNYDSFTYNIVQYLGELGQKVQVYPNDAITLEQIISLKPDYLLIGPGPCSPKEAGISVPCIRYFSGKIPILGICLGHQAIGEAFGGTIVRAQKAMHGKTSPVFHHNLGVFNNLPNPVTCTRCHSLVIERATLPETLHVTAWTREGEIMGVRHRDLAVEGVQFHPEGLLTEHGRDMLHHFLMEFLPQ